MAARGDSPSVRAPWQALADQGLLDALEEAWRSTPSSLPDRLRACGNILRDAWNYRREIAEARHSRSSTSVVAEALDEMLAESQKADAARGEGGPQDALQEDNLPDRAAPADVIESPQSSGDIEPGAGVGPAAPADRAEGSTPPVKVIDFLNRVREKERSERERLDARWETHRSRERRLFGVLLVVGIVTAGLLVLGVVLALAGLQTVAVVTAVVALLPGGGTLLLRYLWADERAAGKDLERAQREHAEMLDAVEFTLSLPEDQRTPQASELARRLQERAFEAAERRQR